MSIKRKYGIRDLEKKYGKLTVGRFLRSWRLSEGLSQKDFSKKIRLSPANLCDLEKERKGVSLEKAYEIAKLIGYPPAVLVRMALQEQIEQAGLKYEVEIKPAA